MPPKFLRICGLVQGVGFRPHVWRLASELGLTGWVRNDGQGVSIAVSGERIAEFLARLPEEAPPQARIDCIEEVTGLSTPLPEAFTILDSIPGPVATAIGPDTALCPACIADICDPANRRWRYPFTTCTHCGPRYTVSRQLPYDRANTSLADFPLCAPCHAEYLAPADRRFHAETSCCPTCGPNLSLLDNAGLAIAGDPLAATVSLLRAGKIVAIKGLGGFHLACDARNPEAVAELRQRKLREAKPFAIMGLNAASLAEFALIETAELALLESAAAPIVLCRKAAGNLPGIAPGMADLGIMLPSTPLHLLLWHEAAGRPAGTDWLDQPAELLLVMTSANPGGEPLVIGNEEAQARLAWIADAFLLHDRPIVARCDDSVVRAGPRFIRRARGYVPLPIRLADDGPTVLALGGYLKNTVCVLKGREAFLSPHIGSLDNAASIAFLEETVNHLLGILDVKPDLIAHDLHPDFASTHLALRLAQEWNIPAFAIGHHHAHLAAICAEHAINEPLTGLAIDGTGLGPDGGSWGGELLHLDGAQCTRLGHLQTLKLPGGDRAAREPWRMAVSAMHGAGLDYRVGGWLKQHYPQYEAGPLLTMLGRNLRCPPSSSLGRWFDAVAGLLGLRAEAQFEGQAAMELEALAQKHGPVATSVGGYTIREGILDFSPLLVTLLGCRDTAEGAALFHATVAAGLAEWLLGHDESRTDATVNPKKWPKMAVAGGCAMNTVLMSALSSHLAAAGVTLLEARRAPPNDGGLALGQAWVARQMFKEMKHVSGNSGASC